jgi:hypothetical protein
MPQGAKHTTCRFLNGSLARFEYSAFPGQIANKSNQKSQRVL